MWYIEDIQSKGKIKKFYKNMFEEWNKYQNKFAYRKVQTNDWLKRANKNKDKLPWNGEPLAVWKLLKWLWECCTYKIDWLQTVQVWNELKANVRFVSWKTCQRYKLCANCARLKANKNKARFIDYINKNPLLLKKNWYYLVLTIRHQKQDDLVESFSRLTGGIQKIRQMIKDSKRGKNNTIFQYMEGAILAIEVTYWINGRHPHCNFLFCSDHNFSLTTKWQTQINKDITNARKKITMDSHITSIKKVEVKEHVYEVLKYITKFSELPHEKRLELHFRTKSFRFLRKWGLLNNAPVTDDSVVDFAPEKRREYEMLLATKWNRNYNRYDIDIDATQSFNSSDKFVEPEMAILATNAIKLLNHKIQAAKL